MMEGEKNLEKLLQTMKPSHNEGDYVFCVVKDVTALNNSDIVMLFRESEAFTVIIKKELADSLKLEYSFVASWITLTVHSSLEAAAFSKALSQEGISCNVVAAFYHDHIFVSKNDTDKAMEILNRFAK
jgi:hypothetical protein